MVACVCLCYVEDAVILGACTRGQNEGPRHLLPAGIKLLQNGIQTSVLLDGMLGGMLDVSAFWMNMDCLRVRVWASVPSGRRDAFATSTLPAITRHSPHHPPCCCHTRNIYTCASPRRATTCLPDIPCLCLAASLCGMLALKKETCLARCRGGSDAEKEVTLPRAPACHLLH